MAETLSTQANGETLEALERHLAAAMRVYLALKLDPPHGIQLGATLSTAKALCTAFRNREAFRERSRVRARNEGDQSPS